MLCKLSEANELFDIEIKQLTVRTSIFDIKSEHLFLVLLDDKRVYVRSRFTNELILEGLLKLLLFLNCIFFLVLVTKSIYFSKFELNLLMGVLI